MPWDTGSFGEARPRPTGLTSPSRPGCERAAKGEMLTSAGRGEGAGWWRKGCGDGGGQDEENEEGIRTKSWWRGRGRRRMRARPVADRSLGATGARLQPCVRKRTFTLELCN